MKSQYLLLILLLCSGQIFGQDQPAPKSQDLELWSSIELSRDIGKDVGISIGQAYRAAGIGSITKQVFSDLGVSYKFHKRWKTAANIRFYELSSGNRMRMQADFSYQPKKWGRYNMSTRLRYQSVLDTKGMFEDAIRLKAQLEYNIKGVKIDPFLSSEVYFQPVPGRSQIDTYRITLGMDWRYKKRQSVKLFFRLEEEIFVANPDQVGVASVSWSYRFKS